MAVDVLADGSPVEGCVVENGSITLPYAARTVAVGLRYVSRLSPMPLELDTPTGATLGRQRSLGRCTVRLHASVGGKYGVSPDRLHEIPFVPAAWGEACVPFSGDIEFNPGGGVGSGTNLWLVQDRPLPFNVSALVADVRWVQQ